MASWVRTKSQERVDQNKQSGALALIVYVEVRFVEEFDHYKAHPKTP